MLLWGYCLFKNTIPLKNSAKRPTVLAGFFLGLHFACFFWGVRNTSIANATLLANTGPLFTIAISYFKNKTISRDLIVPLLITTFGVLLIQWSSLGLFKGNLLGNLASLFSGFCIANTYLIAKKIRKENNNLAYGRSLFFYAAATIGFICFFSNVSILDFKTNDILWFLFLGLVPSILGHNSLNYALKYLSPTAIASVPLGEPIIASIMAYLLFLEKIPYNSIIGAPFVFIGIYFIIKKTTSKTN